jgi:hypothetical protein
MNNTPERQKELAINMPVRLTDITLVRITLLSAI